MRAFSSVPSRMRPVYVTVFLFVLLGVGPLISNPFWIDYIVSNHELPLLPWGACCGFKGPVSDFLGLEAVVILLYLELLAISPLSILTGFLIWKLRKSGGSLGIYLSLGRVGITLIGFAAPYGVIYIVQLLLLGRIWTNLR